MGKWIGLGLILFLVACSDDGQTSVQQDAGDQAKGPGGETGSALPADTSMPGPWAVGARTVSVGDLTVEVWYPATPSSEDGKEKLVYDLTQFVPDSQMLEDDGTFALDCDCYAELPLDGEGGPRPVILFIHGFAGMRLQSLNHMTHWASRGFIVVAADHTPIGLTRLIEEGVGGLLSDGGSPYDGVANCDPSANVQSAGAVEVLDALQDPSGELAFLKDKVDMDRVGAAGHSAGARAIQPLSTYPGVRVLVPMSMFGVCPDGLDLESTLVMGGSMDAVTPFSQQQKGYDEAPVKRRLVGLARSGHMAFTDFCAVGDGEGGVLAAAMDAGLVLDAATLAVIGNLSSDGCGMAADGMPYLAPEVGWDATNAATAAAFEETLLDMPQRAQTLEDLMGDYPEAVEVYQQTLE